MRAILLLMILYLAPVESVGVTPALTDPPTSQPTNQPTSQISNILRHADGVIVDSRAWNQDRSNQPEKCTQDCTKIVDVVECRIGIRGITVAEFDAETEMGGQIRDAFIATIAENLKICGPFGDAQCVVNNMQQDVKFGILAPNDPTMYPDREEKNMTFWKKVERNQLGDPAIVSFYVYTTEDQITKPRADANGYAISPAAKVLKELLDMSANQPKGITAKLKLNLAKIEGYVLPQMKIPDVFGGYTYLDDFSIGVWFQPAGLFALESIPPTHSAGLQAATVSFATLAVAGSAAALLMF